MPEPISAPNLPPPLPDTCLPPEAPTAGSPERLYDGVSVVLESAGASCSAPSGGPTAAQLGALLEAFRANGGGGVYAILESRPDVRAAVGRLGPEELECALVAEDPSSDSRSILPPWSTDAERIVRETTAYFDDLVHSLTVIDGQAAARQALATLDGLESDLPAQLDALRGAEPGTPDAAIAAMLGIEGDPGDLLRARERIAQLRPALEDFADRLPDHTWTQSDFPAASARALAKIGLGGAPGGSIADLAAGETPGWLDGAVSTVLEGVHVAYGGMEIAHLPRAYQTFANAASVAKAGQFAIFNVLAAGLVIEAEIHHLNEESHARFVATGRLLGM